jgi:hypothetical protein
MREDSGILRSGQVPVRYSVHKARRTVSTARGSSYKASSTSKAPSSKACAQSPRSNVLATRMIANLGRHWCAVTANSFQDPSRSCGVVTTTEKLPDSAASLPWERSRARVVRKPARRSGGSRVSASLSLSVTIRMRGVTGIRGFGFGRRDGFTGAGVEISLGKLTPGVFRVICLVSPSHCGTSVHCSFPAPCGPAEAGAPPSPRHGQLVREAALNVMVTVFDSLGPMVTVCSLVPYSSCQAVSVYVPGGIFLMSNEPSLPVTW